MRLVILMMAGAVLLAACTYDTGDAGRLVVIDDGDVVTLDADGGNRSTIATSDLGSFFQPIWSPDRSLVAFSLNAEETAMYVADIEAGSVYSIATDTLPFYFSWSSTNRLAILRNGDDGLRLDTTSIADEAIEELHMVETGQPLYFSWSPDGRELAAHIGIDRLVRNDQSTSETLGIEPGIFQAPHWTSQGIVALESATGDQHLTVVTPDGTSTPFARLTGSATFVLNHDGSKVAAQSIGPEPNGTTAAYQQIPRLSPNRLSVVDIESGELQTVTTGPALAYFWSPRDDQLLVLDIAPGPTARWSIWSDGDLREIVRFDPDPTFVNQFVPFFDQYAQSASLWAPDGTAFAFPGSVDGQSGIWVQPIAGTATRISNGTWVSWAP